MTQLTELATNHERPANTKLVLYYADLLCEKLDLHVDAFIKRLDALRQGNSERVEFIEKMALEPLDKQIAYLAKKTSSLIQGDKNG